MLCTYIHIYRWEMYMYYITIIEQNSIELNSINVWMNQWMNDFEWKSAYENGMLQHKLNIISFAEWIRVVAVCWSEHNADG